uniref:Uncharacterized protein n=1 Tax=Oryza glumipatula TaxID=40148 RepID=A0A0E0BGG8_9ORYZ
MAWADEDGGDGGFDVLQSQNILQDLNLLSNQKNFNELFVDEPGWPPRFTGWVSMEEPPPEHHG